MSNRKPVGLITIRSPLPNRYSKMRDSLSKIVKVRLITGTIIPTVHLRMNLETVLAYAVLFGKCFERTYPAIVDAVAISSFMFKSKKDLVVDFRTPFPTELEWLGHRKLAALARVFEKTLKDVELVTTPNERLALLCEELGANSVHVIPNYPTRNFKPSIDAETWKSKHGLSEEDRVVLFTGGVRLKQIYGLDLLLDSWKLVQESDPYCVLAILGDDCLDYVIARMRQDDIHRLLLSGRVSQSDVANWINCADVCLAPRTLGFPSSLYDDKDSTKISEYAALEKPVVASGYAPSDQYMLVNQNPQDFAMGILKGLDGKITPPKPHYWEENEHAMLKILEDYWFG